MNDTNLKIQVLGTGCPTCKKLLSLTGQAVSELVIKADIEYVSDIEKIIALGVFSTPALVVNNKTVLSGGDFDLEKIKRALN